jgi:hypothetical protein
VLFANVKTGGPEDWAGLFDPVKLAQDALDGEHLPSLAGRVPNGAAVDLAALAIGRNLNRARQQTEPASTPALKLIIGRDTAKFAQLSPKGFVSNPARGRQLRDRGPRQTSIPADSRP